MNVQHRLASKVGSEAGKAIIVDFSIGGHAQIIGASILTRDLHFSRTNFPAVPRLTPEKTDL